AVLYHRVRFELKLYGTVIVCIDTMLFDIKDNLDYLLHEFIAILRQRWWAISYGIKVNKGKERKERYDEQEEEEEKQSKFEQKRKESVKKKAKRESISNAEEEDNEEKEITEEATENIDTCCFNDLDSPVNKAGSAGRLKAVYVRTEHGVLFEVFSSYNKNLQAVGSRFLISFCWFFAVQLLQNLSITAIGSPQKLLRVIKNPFTNYLQENSAKLSQGSLLVRLVTTGGLLKGEVLGSRNAKRINNLSEESLGLTCEGLLSVLNW
ncbi:hypothetical protein DY000_02061543, partial [Brassica cretica]